MGRRPNPEVTQLSSRLSGPSFPGRGRHIQTRRNSRRGTGRIAGDCPWTRQAAVAGRSPCSGDRGRGWAPVSGPVVYPAVGPALRLPFCEGTCISDPGNSAARHMPSCGNLHGRARTAAWWATVGFAENGGCAGSGPSPRYPAVRQVQVSSRPAAVRISDPLRSTKRRTRPLPGTPRTPPAAARLAARLTSISLAGSTAAYAGNCRTSGERNRMFLFPTHAPNLTSR